MGKLIRELLRKYIIFIQSNLFKDTLMTCASQKEFIFFQIGAGNGISHDYIRDYVLKYKWKGIMVEPVKYIFEELKENYKGQNGLIFENVAIASKREFKTFYRLQKSNDPLPSWYDELGSFNLDVILKHESFIPDIRERIVKEEVLCESVENLIKKYCLNHIDLLQIDTEGYDYELLSGINLNQIRPKMIRYEHKHLSKCDMESCKKLLQSHGYTVIQEDHVNTFAWLNNITITCGIVTQLVSLKISAAIRKIKKKLLLRTF